VTLHEQDGIRVVCLVHLDASAHAIAKRETGSIEPDAQAAELDRCAVVVDRRAAERTMRQFEMVARLLPITSRAGLTQFANGMIWLVRVSDKVRAGNGAGAILCE